MMNIWSTPYCRDTVATRAQVPLKLISLLVENVNTAAGHKS